MEYKIRRFNKIHHYFLVKYEQSLLYIHNWNTKCKFKIIRIDDLEFSINFVMKDILMTGFSHCIQLDAFKLRDEAYKLEEELYSNNSKKVSIQLIHQHGFLYTVEFTKYSRTRSFDNFKYIVWTLRYLTLGSSVLMWERSLARRVCLSTIKERKSVERYGSICI